MNTIGTNQHAPQGLDLTAASAARICNWLLGGEHHWAMDRDMGARAEWILPAITSAARANRDFIARAVRLSASYGIRQFADIGCGSPLDVTVHDLAADDR